MPVQFRQPNGAFPKDGFLFYDPHTGQKFDDDKVDLNHQAKLVAEHRRGNPRIYPPDKPIAFDHEAIQQEIRVQTCSRVPSYCEDSARPGQPYPFVPTEPPAQIYRQAGKVCPKCQFTEFEIQYCKTCGAGKRITGYKCLKCAFVMS